MPTSASVPDVTIRTIDEAEWEAYRALRLRALELDPLAFGSTLARERDFTPDRWKDWLRPASPSQPSVTWVAVDATGRFVGMLVAVGVEQTIRLFAMWVEPGARRRGIGRKLLDVALEWARSHYPDRAILLHVNPRQVAAVALYRSCGFRVTGKDQLLDHTPGERAEEMALEPASIGR